MSPLVYVLHIKPSFCPWGTHFWDSTTSHNAITRSKYWAKSTYVYLQCTIDFIWFEGVNLVFVNCRVHRKEGTNKEPLLLNPNYLRQA